MNVHLPSKPFTLAGVGVSDAMRPGVVTCSPDDGFATIAQVLVTNRIHAAVLAPLQRDSPMIVTDRALVRAALERSDSGRASEIVGRASAIAPEAVATLPSDAALDAAVAIMAERFARHLLVTDSRSGAPVGIVSTFDVAAVLGGHQARPARAVRPVPARPSTRARSLNDAIVREVMQSGIATCRADALLSTVARTMAEQRVHCVAVAGIERAGEHLIWGLIDDLDLLVAQHRGALADPAASIAATSPMAVEETDSLAHAAALMVEHDTSHVVVVGPSGLPTGIVSTLDVLSILATGA